MIPLVVRVEDEGTGGEQFAFNKSPVRIGRGELNDLPLSRPFVSTYHGLIQFDDQGAHYVDLGSTNGSVLDGVRLGRNQPAPLQPTAELVIGTLRLTFSRRVTSERPAVTRAASAFALRAATGVGLRSAVAPGPEAMAAKEAGTPAPAPAVPVPAPPAATPEDEAAARAAVEAAALDLDLHYASYRGAWEHLRSALEGATAGLDGPARGVALERFRDRYPALVAEPQFAAMTGGAAAPAGAQVALQAAPPPAARAAASAAASGDLGAEALRLLRAFGESYLPAEPRLDTPQQIEGVLGRVAELLENFGRSFLELQRGYEEFGKEMGVRTVQAEGALHRARDARQVLAYLLDPRAQGRDLELQRAFADFMIHQVALLRGVVEGAQGLLARLSPEAIERVAPQSLWPLRGAALWKIYEERFHELADEEDAVSDLVFGKEFARAYAALVGQRAPDEGGAEGERPGSRRPRR